MGEDSFVAKHSFGPQNASITGIADSYFGYNLQYVPTTMLVTKGADGKWTKVLTPFDLNNGPLDNTKLYKTCKTGVHPDDSNNDDDDNQENNDDDSVDDGSLE